MKGLPNLSAHFDDILNIFKYTFIFFSIVCPKEHKNIPTGRQSSSPQITAFTCLMAVTVMTKKRGRPLVIGLVGVSTITCRQKEHTGDNLLSGSRRNKSSGHWCKRVLGTLGCKAYYHTPAQEGRKGHTGKASKGILRMLSSVSRQIHLLLKAMGCPHVGKSLSEVV